MVKTISLTAVLLLSSYAYSATSPSCPGEEGYYFTNYKRRNPQQGGFVSNKADVQDTDEMIFIGPEVAICGSSRVSGRARIFGNAVIRNSTVKDNAEISGDAVITNGAEVSGNAKVSGKARIFGFVEISEDAVVTDNAQVYNKDSEKLARVQGKARVGGDAHITEDAVVEGSARVNGNAKLFGDVRVEGSALVKGYTKRSSGTISNATLNDPDYEGMEKARKEKEANDRRLREEEEARIRKAQAAELKAIADKNAAEAARVAKLNEMKNDVIGLGVQGGARVTFVDNCHIEIVLKSDDKTYIYDLTRQSTSWERMSQKSGARIEKKGEAYSVVFESDSMAKTIHYLQFPAESEDAARKVKASFDSLFKNCQ